MVLEVFESARRPKCHVTASLRHVRRLESARTPKKAPPSARGATAKRVVSNARSAIFDTGGHFHDLWACPPQSLFRVDPNCRAARRLPPKTAILPKKNPLSPAPPFPRDQICQKKTKKKSPGGIELTTTRRPQQITMGSETMGLTVLLKEPPISPTS